MRAEVFFSLLFWAFVLVTAIGVPVVLARDLRMRRKYRKTSPIPSANRGTEA